MQVSATLYAKNKMNPNVEEIVKSIDEMSKAMGLASLPSEVSEKLVMNILYDEELDGREGRNGWESFKNNLITVRELRDLVMCNSATYIAKFNKVSEPGAHSYSSSDLSAKFELAIFSNRAK